MAVEGSGRVESAPDAPVAARRRSRVVSWAVRILAVVVICAVVILGIVAWIGSERAIHPAAPHYSWSLATYPQLHPQAVGFTGADGVHIAGRFFPGRSHATIVLSHGFGQDEEQMLPWAAFLHDAGYSVLTYDMRARGRSGGAAVTLGAREQFDLVAAVSYLTKRPDVDGHRIGALGVSLGGATTILAAARDPRIRAVVDDCGFADVQSVVDASFTHFIHLPAFPFAPLTVALAEARAGVQISAVRPVAVIGRISPRPIFIIHGTADTTVPPGNSLRNYAAAGEPKQLWLVPGAAHTQSRTVAGATYTRRVVAFFRRYLGA